MVSDSSAPEKGYEGVKFRTETLGIDVPNDPRIKELSFWCQIFDERGLAPPYEGGSYGNLSFRLKPNSPSFIITAAKSGLAESKAPNRFVTVDRVDFERGIVYARGSRQPSSESMVHSAIYDLRPEIQAIFHGHSKEISANAERLGIPITTRKEEYGTIALVRRVQESLNGNPFLEMRDHGFLSMGETINEAGNNALHYLERAGKR